MRKKSKKLPSKKSKRVVMVSGGFDPVHIGHARLFNAAKKLGNKLVVVINNDHWIKLKKGKGFMGAPDRAELISAFRAVDQVIISKHKKNTKDMSVCEDIREIKPNIFANGGDRKPDGDPVPEVAVCKELSIKMVYNVGKGGKIRSSSELLKTYSQKK